MNEDNSMNRATFGKSNRLLCSDSYKKVFQSNQKVSDNSFLILAHHIPQGEARLGLAVAKKVLKLAVDRNRIKRVIRESFRNHKSQLKQYDLVVLVRRGCIHQTNKQLMERLEKLWNRLNQKVE